MVTRRQTFALLAAAGAIPALAACGPNAGSSGGEDGGAVRIYWWGGDLRLGLTEEALALFEEAHPDIPVAPEYSEWTGYWDKLATQTSGGDAPDLLQMDEAYIDSYGTRGALLDLESIPDVLDLSGMEESMLETGRLADGTLVGAPLGIGIFSVGVNLDLLEQSGVEAPDDTTWTWDDLKETAAAISAWAEEAGEDVTGLDNFGQGAAEIAAWGRQAGEQLFPREDESPLTQQTLVDFLEYANSLVEEGATAGVSEQIEDAAAGVEQGRFGTGRCVFHFQFHTQVQTFQSASGARMTLWRLPAITSGDPQMVNKASMYWSIAETSQQPEQAGTLMSFLLTDPEAAKVLKIERGVTAFPEVQDAIEPELDEIETISLDFARDMQAEVVRAPRVTPANGVAFGTDFTRLSQDYYFGNADATTTADQILAALEGMQPEE